MPRAPRIHVSLAPPAAVGLALLLAACGSDALSGPTLSGVFLDSAVEGMAYESGGESGITGPDGDFTYEFAGDVTFSLGDVVIGTARGARVMTPVTLAPKAVDERDQEATNIARFLLSLDDDEDPSNGIFIPDAARLLATGSTLDFDLDPVTAFPSAAGPLVGAMTSVTVAGARPLVSITEARDHLRATLLAAVAGTYAGTLAGDETGTWEAVVDADGTLTGTGTSALFGAFSLSGTFESDWSAAFADGAGRTYSGTFTGGGGLTGTWTRTGTAGTFAGTRQSGP